MKGLLFGYSGLLPVLFTIFLHGSRRVNAATHCKYNTKGTCINLDKTYCTIGNKISNSIGECSGSKEVCCYPVERTIPKFEYGMDDCGIPFTNNLHRVVGGEAALIQAHPWMASVQKLGQPVCGGSIVGDRWILTAAHCVQTHLSTITVVVGTSISKFGRSWNTLSKRHYVDKIFQHKRYVKGHTSKGYDIAMIKLSKPLDLGGTKVRRVCLPSQDQTFQDDVCVATGWGYEREPTGAAKTTGGTAVLKQANLPILSKTQCRHYNGKLSWGTVCAGYSAGGEDTCQGDSGGPLVCQTRDGLWRQAGIVSYGRGCGRRHRMGVYTEVAAFSGWIKYVMEHK